MSDLSTIMQIPALTNLSGLKRVLPAATPNAFLKQRVGCFILSSKLVLHSRIASGEPKSGQFATDAVDGSPPTCGIYRMIELEGEL